ncbi:MAG TPA: MerR family transcriptional regulator [archaeon]|nr:MerR family transcriptional regulator [archaeon]
MYLKIGKVSQKVGLSIKRIREYEKEGLIKPMRGETSNQRLYGSFEISRIMQIKQLIHERGLTVTGIKTLLNLAPCWTVFNCKETGICPAYKFPYNRCWELKERFKEEVACMGECVKCPIYLAIVEKVPPLFEKTPKEA